ncbi:hypothetical protein MMC11_006781 [Xylographa trunciseda]|nr:hypothetical protein [Xylographa trunciseda]
MAIPVHSYGPSCALHEDFNNFTRKASELSDEAPHLRPQFFYSSILPIDDPLSPLPAPSTSSSSGSSRFPPRPFSTYDNVALEEAWQGLRKVDEKGTAPRQKVHGHGPRCHDVSLKDQKGHGHGTTYNEVEHDSGKMHRYGPFCTGDGFEGEKRKQHISQLPEQASQNTATGFGYSQGHESDSTVENLAKIMKETKTSGSAHVNDNLESKDRERATERSKLSTMTPISDSALPDVNGEHQGTVEVSHDKLEHISSWRIAGSSSPFLGLAMPPHHVDEQETLICDDPEHDPSPVVPQRTPIFIGTTKSVSEGNPHVLLCDDPQHIPFDDSMPIGSDEVADNEFEAGVPGRRHRSIFHRKNSNRKEKVGKSKPSPKPSRSSSRHKSKAVAAPYGSSPSERHTTGNPFLRAPSPKNHTETHQNDGANAASDDERARLRVTSKPISRRYHSDRSLNSGSEDIERPKSPSHPGSAYSHKEQKAYVPMKPIYWSPVHDVSAVVRGTWFYKETMRPVDANIANRLEEGYEYMRPWTHTYKDELKSCLEVGAEAELKVVHKLWPSEEPSDTVSRPGTSKNRKTVHMFDPVPLTPEEKARKEAAERASRSENRAVGDLMTDGNGEDAIRFHTKSSVIYANGRDAQILKPSQLPSLARGRRPLGPILKGRIIGLPVVRGFDQKVWDKLYPQKKSSTAKKAHAGAIASQSGAAATTTQRDACPACLAGEQRSKVTDLVLVIHGIGQKLSERIESYHFTHAINAFRRQLNVELESEAVQPWLRQDLGGVMVLPINWRSTLSFEDGGPNLSTNTKHDESSPKEFTLKDITAETIPAVRNLISDVMLDIPYYLSHHKPKMIEAVIKEANRIYRLWCLNNPGFQETGRVHLIAHSLGSVMALDILSKQPTKLPERLDLTNKKVHKQMFEFDTKNLFFCGSPAGFFLLLNHAPLVPRRGRGKPESDEEDLRSSITAEAGTYGCLAVDNVYNIMHYNDPIAYRVNACVDVDYAASLQPAAVPSATSTWLQSIGYVFRGKPATPVHSTTNIDVLIARPTVGKVPSTMEMETHNFTLEEMAEQKMYLLNDNGQIDFFLSSGGGPLEIQYFNMLGAHSSYWVLQDFVRFLVVEIGRKPGRSETLLGMRAVKKVWGKK